MASNSNSVNEPRKDYTEAAADWALVADAAKGERAIKAKGEVYLPIPNPKDTSAENMARYDQYKLRANFYNATGRTLKGLVGAAFRKLPTFTAPAGLEYLTKDADGAGVSIHQQARSTLSGVLTKGRRALLVDYPTTDGSTSRAQQAAGGIRATICSIPAENVINWRTTVVGARRLFSLVVIRENRQEPDGFATKVVKRCRVLKLIQGIYHVEIWEETQAGWDIAVPAYAPRNAAGAPWNIIPFTFVGAENNDEAIDDAPLLDLARVNIAHYRNSADYEDSVFFNGQPQPWISGLTAEWRDYLDKKGFVIGSRTIIPLPEGGAFGFAQAQANTLAEGALTQKEEQMVALGARLVQKGGAVKTATEAQDDNEAEHSVLSLAASNVSAAYTQAMEWCGLFNGQDSMGAVEYEISQDFIEHKLDAQMLGALVSAWQSGTIPKSDLWAQLRKYGLIDPEKTDEDLKDELDAEDPDAGARTGAVVPGLGDDGDAE